MPSLQDVADQINAKLDEIIVNTAQNVTATGQVRDQVSTLNDRVAALDTNLRAGLTNLAEGLFAIWEVEKASLAELRHQSNQNDTIICLLENANELLCGMTRKMTAQLEVSQGTNAAVRRLEGIAERAEPAAAGDFDRLRQVTDRITECCPEEPEPPEPCPEPCPQRPFTPYQPDGQDWSPRRPPNPPR